MSQAGMRMPGRDEDACPPHFLVRRGCLVCLHSLNTPVKSGCWQHTPFNPNTQEVEQSSRTVRIETLSQSPWSTCQASERSG